MRKSLLLCACVLVTGCLCSATLDYRQLMAGYGMSESEIDMAMQYMDSEDAAIPEQEQNPLVPPIQEPLGEDYQIPEFDEAYKEGSVEGEWQSLFNPWGIEDLIPELHKIFPEHRFKDHLDTLS